MTADYGSNAKNSSRNYNKDLTTKTITPKSSKQVSATSTTKRSFMEMRSKSGTGIGRGLYSSNKN